MRKDILLATVAGSPVAITPVLLQLLSHLTKWTGSLVYLLGSRSGRGSRARKVVARPQLSNRSRLRVQNSINDNDCVKCVTRLKDFVYVSGKVDSLNPSPVLVGKKNLSVASKRETVNQSCSFCKRLYSKERYKSQLLLSLSKNKVCERCFLCILLEFCKSCHKCPNCCSRSTCRGQIAPVLGEVCNPRGQPQSGNSTHRRLHPPLLVPAKFDQVTNRHKLLCKSPQEPLLVGGIASASEQKCSGTGSN